MLFFLVQSRRCYFALHGLECAGQRSPGAWVSALVAWLLCSAISGKGERSHLTSYFPYVPSIVLIIYFRNFLFILGLTFIFDLCPIVGKFGVEGELTHTPPVVHAGCPNTD